MHPGANLRRMRRTEGMRKLVRETMVSVDDLICPVFVDEQAQANVAIDSMPDVYRIPLDGAGEEARSIRDLGIPAIMLFGIPSAKDDAGSSAYDPGGVAQRAIRGIREACDGMVIMSDVCLCQYTSSGHCRVVRDGRLDNDSTLEALARVAVSHAEAGTDVVVPSAVADGQVAAIRAALDGAGFQDVAIMSQSAKQRSNFYAPFRDAAECAPKSGDRRGYQAPYTNAREAIREMEADVEEGVDIIMIKPALAYLDLVAEASRRFSLPVSAYSVSGEYAMVQAAARNGWIQGDEMAHEILASIKRAGADMITTYFAKRVAAYLNGTGPRV